MPRFVTVTDSINKKTYAIEVSSIVLVEKDDVSTRITMRDGNFVETQDADFDEIMTMINGGEVEKAVSVWRMPDEAA